MAKYGTKQEENSKGFQAVFNSAVRKGIANESEAKTVLRSIFLKASAGREKTQQTAHLMMGLPLVRCSEEFISVNLYNNLRLISVNNRGSEENQQQDNTIIQRTLIDAYAKRMDARL